MLPRKTEPLSSTPVLTNVSTIRIAIVGPVEHGYPEWKEGVNKAYWGVKQLPPEGAPKIHL
jgi:hypothetical protein